MVPADARSRAFTSVLHATPAPWISGRAVPSLSCSTTFAFAGARTETRTRSSPRSPTVPDGVTLPRSTARGPVSGSGMGSGRSVTGTVALKTKSPFTARSSYRGASPDGTGNQARNAPLGRTGTSNPSIIRCAAPEPVDPKMKFESRTVSTWLGAGYTTRRFNGPSTVGMGGSAGAVTGTAAGAGRAGAPAGAAAGGTGVRAAAGGGASTGPGAREQVARRAGATARRCSARRISDNHMEAFDWPLPEPRSIFAPLGAI